MAVKKLKSEFNDFLTKEIKKLKGGFFIGPNDILYATAGGKDFVEALKLGATAICKAHDKNLLQYNTDARWNTAIRQVSKELKAANEIKVGDGSTYVFQTGDKFKIRSNNTVELNGGVYVENLTNTKMEFAVVTSTEDASSEFIKVEKLFDALKDAVWDKWVERLFKELGKQNVSVDRSNVLTAGGRYSASNKRIEGAGGRRKRFGNLLSANVKRAHTGETTTTVMALEKLERSTVAISGMGVNISAADLTNEIAKGLKIDFARERRKKKGVTNSQINFIEVRLARNQAEKRGSKGRDKRAILDAAQKHIKTRIENAVAEGVLPIGFDTEASKPFKDAVVDDAINIVVEGLLKNGNRKRVKKLNLNTTKSPEIKEQGINLYKGKRLNSRPDKRKNLSLAGKIATSAGSFSGRKRTQSGKLRGTRFTPARLKSIINRSLPAEVRRNMGRPALINQTSRFSNSVVLNSLRDGKNSLIGEYSYQLNPYQTFENTGEKQWPRGYNPKPLIAKSIRNIAARHVENKFTLRRT